MKTYQVKLNDGDSFSVPHVVEAKSYEWFEGRLVFHANGEIVAEFAKAAVLWMKVVTPEAVPA